MYKCNAGCVAKIKFFAPKNLCDGWTVNRSEIPHYAYT